MSDNEVRGQTAPVEVTVKNFSDAFVKPRLIKSTVLMTYVIDSGDVNKKLVQICDYEPNRVRLVVQPIDHEVGITNEVPRPTEIPLSASPLVGYSAIRYLPPNGASAGYEYVFFGPDAFWLVCTGAVTGRVTVTKEYA